LLLGGRKRAATWGRPYDVYFGAQVIQHDWMGASGPTVFVLVPRLSNTAGGGHPALRCLFWRLGYPTRLEGDMAQASLSCPCGAIHLLRPLRDVGDCRRRDGRGLTKFAWVGIMALAPLGARAPQKSGAVWSLLPEGGGTYVVSDYHYVSYFRAYRYDTCEIR